MSESRSPFPPFTRDTALQKVRAAEDAWNSCNPGRVSLAYTPDCYWRNRSEFICGRAEIIAFLKRKWAKELDYRLIKELWAFTADRIAVSPMNGMTIRAAGFAPPGTRTGSFQRMF